MIYTLTLNPAVDRELTVPEIEFDTVLRASRWQVDFGGKGFNVSRMLRALDTDSVALGFAGGRSGELLRDGLQAMGIATDFVWVAGETRTNVSIVPQDHGRYLKINEPGPMVSSAEQMALVQKVCDLAQPGDWWVLAGSLPPGVPPTIYVQLISDIQNKGARVILDTSGQALHYGCDAGPYLVKPNDVELGQLTGEQINTLAGMMVAAKKIQASGVDNILVSLGKKGALLVTADGAWQAGSPQIVEANPIGAGDSMVGGLVYGLSQQMALPQALRWGLACGAATASLSGTQVGDRTLVETLLDQVAIQAFVPDAHLSSKTV